MAAKRKTIPEEFVPLFVRYRRDRAIRAAGNDGELLFIRALAHARDNATAGHIEDFDLDELCAGMKDPVAVAGRLVAHQLWIQTPSGWLIRSWEKWNPRDASESGTYGNHQRWHEARGIVQPGCDHCPQEPEEYPEPIASDRVASPPIAPDDHARIAPDSGQGIGCIAEVEVEGEVEGEEESKEMVTADALTLIDAPPAATRYPDDFEAWWRLYPSKTGKADALKAWRKATRKATREVLAAGVERYKLTRRVRDGVVKNASTWLNQECWLDEHEAPRIQNASGVDWAAAKARAAMKDAATQGRTA